MPRASLCRRALLAAYKDVELLPPGEVAQPAPYSRPIDELGRAQDAFLCCYSSSSSDSRNSNSVACSFISTSRAKIRQHVNQQHQVKLTRWSSTAAMSYKEHAGQLWKPVKVQTFFRERRYVRYFLVQEQSEQQGEQQGEQQSDEQQRIFLLSSSLEAVKRKDSEAMNRIAEEASTKDRTGWFKRTRWDAHLQAYLDWRLLSYAVRLPGNDEPQL